MYMHQKENINEFLQLQRIMKLNFGTVFTSIYFVITILLYSNNNMLNEAPMKFYICFIILSVPYTS